MSNLAVIIEQSGIEKSKQTRIAETLGAFFDKAQEWETAIQSIEITDPSQTLEMELAKSMRLEMKRYRLQGEKLITQQRADIKLRMADDILEDKLWLRAGQMMEAQYANLEGKAQEKERFAEVWEANRILKLRSDRADILRNEQGIEKYIPYGIDLGIMTDDDFTNVLNGAKLQRDAQIAAEKKAEEERIALAKKQEDERIALEKEREETRKATEKENERLRQVAIEKDNELKAEREKAQKEKEEQEEINRKEREETARKLKEAQDETDKANAIIKAKQDAEEKEKAEKIRLEKLAQKKAATASDNEKIERFINDINSIAIPVCSDVDMVIAVDKVSEMIAKATQYLKDILSETKLFETT